ncbi:MAG: hypothetical protein IJ759_07295 [Bacteroidales bacterium]|nr:hypothetical protein [Bacteroidales bacterium]
MTETITATVTESTVNPWFYIAIAEFVAIIVVVVLYFKEKHNHSKKNEIKQKFGNREIDFGNVMMSSFHAKEVYDELKKKCHPDRFVGDEHKTEIADKLFQEITKNKNNYKRLEELKQQAIEELNIRIN